MSLYSKKIKNEIMETMGDEDIQLRRPGFSRWAIPALWGIVVLSLVFAALIFVIRIDDYRLYGHLLEAGVASFCMACCLYAYRDIAQKLVLLLAGFAFFSYALATIFWYLFSLEFGRPAAFSSVAEFGFVCFFLFFIAALAIEFPKEKWPRAMTVCLLVFFVVIPILVFWDLGDRQPFQEILILIRFFLVGQLIEVGIRHGIYRHPCLFAGICLRSLAAIVYGIRETLLFSTPVPLFHATPFSQALTVYSFLSIIGPMIICSFALIMIGLFSYILSGDETGKEQSPTTTV
jgi:hypothetical protein